MIKEHVHSKWLKAAFYRLSPEIAMLVSKSHMTHLEVALLHTGRYDDEQHAGQHHQRSVVFGKMQHCSFTV